MTDRYQENGKTVIALTSGQKRLPYFETRAVGTATGQGDPPCPVVVYALVVYVSFTVLPSGFCKDTPICPWANKCFIRFFESNSRRISFT